MRVRHAPILPGALVVLFGFLFLWVLLVSLCFCCVFCVFVSVVLWIFGDVVAYCQITSPVKEYLNHKKAGVEHGS